MSDKPEQADGHDEPRCVGCGSTPPETSTPYTLISSQFGWRVIFEKTDGRRVPVWRCPNCWTQFKADQSR